MLPEGLLYICVEVFLQLDLWAYLRESWMVITYNWL